MVTHKGAGENTLAAPLQRQIKKHLHGRRHSVLIKSHREFAAACLRETKDFGRTHCPDAVIGPDDTGMIRFSNIDFRTCVTLPVHLTTATEILLILAEKERCDSYKRFEKCLQDIKWDFFLRRPGHTASIRAASTGSRLFHEGRLKLCAHKIINPSSSKTIPEGQAGKGDQAVDIRLHHDCLTVSISLHTQPLHIRGYRGPVKSKASIRETLAASLVRELAFRSCPERASPVPQVDCVLNPFSGSGTLAFEYLVAMYRLPLLLEKNSLSCENWPGAPTASMQDHRKKLLAREEPRSAGSKVVMIDNNASILQAAAAGFATFMDRYAKFAGNLEHKFLNADVFSVDPGSIAGQSTALLINPPWGSRLEQNSRSFTRNLAGWVEEFSAANNGYFTIGLIIQPEPMPVQMMSRMLATGLAGEIYGFRSGGKKVFGHFLVTR